MLKQILEAINPPKSYKELALRHDPVLILDFMNGDIEPPIMEHESGSITSPLSINTKVHDLTSINSLFMEYSVSGSQSHGTLFHYGNEQNHLRIYIVSDLLMVDIVFQDVSYSLVADHMAGMRCRVSLIKDDEYIKLFINEMPLETIPAIESSSINCDIDGWLSIGQMNDGSSSIAGGFYINHIYMCREAISKQSITNLS